MRFVETLRAQGLPSIHRWKVRLDPARGLRTARPRWPSRLRNDAPAGSTVAVEGTSVGPPTPSGRPTPFAIFGGLGV